MRNRITLSFLFSHPVIAFVKRVPTLLELPTQLAHPRLAHRKPHGHRAGRFSRHQRIHHAAVPNAQSATPPREVDPERRLIGNPAPHVVDQRLGQVVVLGGSTIE